MKLLVSVLITTILLAAGLLVSGADGNFRADPGNLWRHHGPRFISYGGSSEGFSFKPGESSLVNVWRRHYGWPLPIATVEVINSRPPAVSIDILILTLDALPMAVAGFTLVHLVWAMTAKKRQKQARQQQTIQAHSVKIEAQDEGGYRVVEEETLRRYS